VTKGTRRLESKKEEIKAGLGKKVKKRREGTGSWDQGRLFKGGKEKFGGQRRQGINGKEEKLGRGNGHKRNRNPANQKGKKNLEQLCTMQQIRTESAGC